MHRNTKIAVPTVLAAGIFAVGMGWHQLLNQLHERYPSLDRKVVRKAFRIMMFRSVTGQLPEVEAADDAQMEIIFFRIVDEITA